MALEVSGQGEWGRGIVRGRKAPPDSVYDAVSALVDDEGNLIRRGGGAYLSTSDAGATLTGLFEGYLVPGSRTLAWATAMYAFDGSNAPVTLPNTPTVYAPPRQFGRAAVFQGVAWLPAAVNTPAIEVNLYGGSRKSAAYTTGTASTTAGSTTMTGAGTLWTANADSGMLLDNVVMSCPPGIAVKEVVSNTQITLNRPFPTTRVAAGYGLWPALSYQTADIDGGAGGLSYVATAGGKILVASGTRIVMSEPDGSFVTGTYHELPAADLITGIDVIGGIVFVFTTGGTWTISNVVFDPVDDAGNVQHQIERLSGDVVLWGDPGVAAWQGMLVVPAIDDVRLLVSDGSSDVLSEAIRPLFRSYVKAGYQPGLASVHRGHYFLPIVNGSTWIDTLVCRLDREGFPWTRWDGHSASTALAQRVGATTRTPKLFGLAAQRVTDLTECLTPTAANALDADGTAHSMVAITRDFPSSGSNHPGTVTKARLRYELTDGGTPDPVVALAWSSDADAGVFTTLTDAGVEASSAAAGGPSDGSAYQWFRVGKKRERLRLRITVTGAAGSFVLRAIELLIRQSGLR